MFNKKESNVTQAAAQKTKSREVEVKRHAQPPASLSQKIKANAGKGLSKAQEDNLVPLIYVLQANSPQVNKRDPAYIQGAEAGDIWLRNAPDPIVSGNDGFAFQPCYFSKCYNEWIPRSEGGGFVARHRTMPTEAKLAEDPQNPAKKKFYLPNGNEIIETREHVGLVHVGEQRMPFVIPLTSTGHSFSRKWMFMMNAKQIDGTDVPSFACVYKLKTVFKSNKAGDWYMLDVEDGDWVSDRDFEAGLQIYEAFASGAKQAEAPVMQESADDMDVVI